MKSEEFDKWAGVLNPDSLTSYEPQGQEQATAEVRFVREALLKALNREQYDIYQMHAYDKATNIEIAKKFKTSHQNISKRIQKINQLLEAWCKEHMEVYKTLKEAEEHNNE